MGPRDYRVTCINFAEEVKENEEMYRKAVETSLNSKSPSICFGASCKTIRSVGGFLISSDS